MTGNTLEASQLHHATVLPGWEILLLTLFCPVSIYWQCLCREPGWLFIVPGAWMLFPCAVPCKREESSYQQDTAEETASHLPLVWWKCFQTVWPRGASRCKETLGEEKGEWWRSTERCRGGKGCCPGPKKHILVFCLLGVLVGRLNFSFLQLREASLFCIWEKHEFGSAEKKGDRRADQQCCFISAGSFLVPFLWNSVCRKARRWWNEDLNQDILAKGAWGGCIMGSGGICK